MSLISVFGRWYRRKFSDPDAAMLLILILLTATVFVFWGGLIMPVLVAAVIAYLLDWPVNRLVNIGVSRTISCSWELEACPGLKVSGFSFPLPTKTTSEGNWARSGCGL